jgi:TetR/AcrR family transcriptional regulator, cholesterol catabolism regulator
VKQVLFPSELRGSQLERRRRVLEAAMELAAEGGYDAVQMRDVAARADVALGTVYRYFTSKDHLLAASLVHWVDQLADALADTALTGANPAERVANLLGRATVAMSYQPRLVAALLTPLSSPEPGVAECRERVAKTMEHLVTVAAASPALTDLPDRARMLGHIWYSTLLSWIHGTCDVGTVVVDLEIASRLLL